MEVTTQYSGASAQAISSAELSARAVAPNASSPQAKIFSESNGMRQFATRPYDQSVKLNPKAAIFPQVPAGKTPPEDDPVISREKRGGVLGKCARSEFRECRGGDALKDGSASCIKFDQSDRKETQGEDGKGLCEGIVRETMRRIDRGYDNPGATVNLPSAVSNMNTDMSSSRRADESNIYYNMQAFQDSPRSLALAHYRSSSTVNLNPDGLSSRTDRINGLIGSMSDMPSGGLALIHAGIQPADAMGPEINGHVLIVQRLPEEAGADRRSSPARYAIFDPNNGVFTYENRDRMQTALRNYMETAFTEIGDGAAPDSVAFFISPSSSRDWGSLPPTTEVPSPDRVLPEPAELLRHFAQSFPSSSTHDELKRRAPSTDSGH